MQELPDQEKYAPPISIKMYDCRSFGRNVYAGTHLVKMKSFFLHPLTRSEWQQIHSGVITKSLERIDTKMFSSILFKQTHNGFKFRTELILF